MTQQLQLLTYLCLSCVTIVLKSYFGTGGSYASLQQKNYMQDLAGITTIKRLICKSSSDTKRNNSKERSSQESHMDADANWKIKLLDAPVWEDRWGGGLGGR